MTINELKSEIVKRKSKLSSLVSERLESDLPNSNPKSIQLSQKIDKLAKEIEALEDQYLDKWLKI